MQRPVFMTPKVFDWKMQYELSLLRDVIEPKPAREVETREP